MAVLAGQLVSHVFFLQPLWLTASISKSDDMSASETQSFSYSGIKKVIDLFQECGSDFVIQLFW